MKRILLIKPCCIGDVVFATPLLAALRRAYPNAHITWAVNTSIAPVLQEHPHLNAVLEVGETANPAAPRRLLGFVRRIRRLRAEAVFVPDRSLWYAVATRLAGIPMRVGLNSGGRGFTYTHKATIKPEVIRHEAEIYLDLARILGILTDGLWAFVPPSVAASAQAERVLHQARLAHGSYLMVHPGGGVNVGMRMIEKRWAAENFAALAERLAERLGAQIAVIGAASDREPVARFKAALKVPCRDWSERFSLAETAALAMRAALYIGNDNGVGHLAAAAGAKVLMIFGPSDPRRYAPFVPSEQARYAWRPVDLPAGGVASGAPRNFNWSRDGVSVDEAFAVACQLC
ncbi:MAG: glycosyltransferase family 9 protein [Anaerolineae bacterium]|nr:glycosyltransferase family 9 protein [Anaerolineae bacterium]